MGALLISARAEPAAQSTGAARSATADDPISAQANDELDEEQVEELQEEVGDRDPTYFRTRAVLSYNHRQLVAPASVDRFRFKWLYGFGPKQRFAASVMLPALRATTASGDVSGVGDAEVQVAANFYSTKRFRMGVALLTTMQTASSALLGGATTTVKPSWDCAAVLSSRVEVTGALYYRQSVHTVRGLPFKQLEPDVTINARFLNVTWFLEEDSYYDIDPSRAAPTLKAGVSDRFGQRWVGSAYYATGYGDYAHSTQYRSDVGFDVTWYPFKN